MIAKTPIRRLSAVVGRRYDTALLIDGTIAVNGFDVDYVDAGKAPGKLFRQGLNAAFDICEQAISHYLIARDQGQPLVALPVFPSRLLPHNCIFVRPDSEIRRPADLVGRRVAVPDFGYNPAVWVRGMLREQYDVAVDEIEWLESKDRPLLGDFENRIGASFRVRSEPAPAKRTAGDLYGLAWLLADNRADAIILPRRPEQSDIELRPLFADPYQEGRRYAEHIGGIPINTVITLTRDAVHDFPSLPASLMSACVEALNLYVAQHARGETGQWHQDLQLDRLTKDHLFPWRYGVQPNQRVIEAMIRYCADQGVIRSPVRIEELFAAKE